MAAPTMAYRDGMTNYNFPFQNEKLPEWFVHSGSSFFNYRIPDVIRFLAMPVLT